MFRLGAKYLHYLLKAKGPHGIHSPFVYQLVTEILPDKTKYPAYAQVEALREKLKQENTPIFITDFGAGMGGSYSLPVSEITRKSAKPLKLAQLLYRLCATTKPEYMLELGTSMGISTAYQALGALEGHTNITFVSLEGSPETADRAQQNLAGIGLEQPVKIITGNFDDTLPLVLKQFSRLDYVFFDGNHRYEPTLSYFRQCLPLAHEGTLFIFDDIRWSAEMEKAWEEIKAHPQATVTVDLFFMGLVFFRPGQVKENFLVRF